MIRSSVNPSQMADLMNLFVSDQKVKKINRALNQLGFEFREEYNHNLNEVFMLRNKHMTSGTGVNKTSLNSLLTQSRVEVGTTRKINLEQELGGQRSPKSGTKYSIAMNKARRGGNEASDLRTKTRMDRLNSLPKYKARNAVEAIGYATREAIEKNHKYFIIEAPSINGIFQLTNIKDGSGKLRKLYDLSNDHVTNQSNPVMDKLADKYINHNLPAKLDPIFIAG